MLTNLLQSIRKSVVAPRKKDKSKNASVAVIWELCHLVLCSTPRYSFLTKVEKMKKDIHFSLI